TEDRPPLFAGLGHHRELPARRQRAMQVEQLAIQFYGDGRLGEPGADGFGHLESGCAVGVGVSGSVGVLEFYGHGFPEVETGVSATSLTAQSVQCLAGVPSRITSVQSTL